jgi:hypothetical protein
MNDSAERSGAARNSNRQRHGADITVGGSTDGRLVKRVPLGDATAVPIVAPHERGMNNLLSVKINSPWHNKT